MGVPCCRMSVAPGREWVARGRRWVADGSRAVAPSRGDVAAMSPGVARLSPECRGLSRWCRGGVAAVAEVFFSVKPATVTNIMTEWGGVHWQVLLFLFWDVSIACFGKGPSAPLREKNARLQGLWGGHVWASVSPTYHGRVFYQLITVDGV